MLTLRPYQSEAINAIRNSFRNGNRRVVLCAPTGSGKSSMFSYMAKEHVERGGRALILTDRIELLKQAGGTFQRLGINPDEIKANHRPDLLNPLHCAMVETLFRRSERYASFLRSRTLVIVDEAHKTAFGKVLELLPESCYVIGATATPFRSGNQPAMDSFYQDIVQTVDTPDLIEMGYLSDARSFGVDIDLTGVKKRSGDWDSEELGKRYSERKVYEGVIENYQRLTPNTKAIAFTPNVASSKELADKFNQAGIHAMHLDGSMGSADRSAVLRWFNSTRSGVLCNCAVLTTGFDQPDIETVILYRATTSLPLFLQMVGRGSRVTPTKKQFTILDFGNNIKEHDFWESPRQWSLEKPPKRKKKDVAPVRLCESCSALIPATSTKCKFCGSEKKQTKKEKKAKEMAMLVELPKPERLARARIASLDEKVEMCKAKAIKAAWVLHNMTNKDEAMEFVKRMGYRNGWYHYNKHRFEVFNNE